LNFLSAIFYIGIELINLVWPGCEFLFRLF